MSVIPLHLQRRFEQRWAARFVRPVPLAAPQKHGHEKQVRQLAEHSKVKREAGRVGSASLRSDPSGVSLPGTRRRRLGAIRATAGLAGPAQLRAVLVLAPAN